LVSDDFWWYVPENYRLLGHSLIDHRSLFKSDPWIENADNLNVRIAQFLDWLRNQEANKIVVFTHGSYIKRIVGFEVGNCDHILKTYPRQR